MIKCNRPYIIIWLCLVALAVSPDHSWGQDAVANAEKLFQQGQAVFMGRDGSEPDPAGSVRFFRVAAEKGHTEAQALLMSGYAFGEYGLTADPAEAVRWAQLCAESGNANCQYYLGVSYRNGTGGLQQDYTEANRLFRLAAEQGLAGGYIELAVAYTDGYGVEIDPTKVAEFYQSAAELEDASARHALALMLERGEGIEKDLERAIFWLHLAANQGYEPAVNDLNRLLQAQSNDGAQ